MVNFKAYGFNLTKSDYKTIAGMFKIITTDEPEILDVRSYEVEIGSEDIVFAFGGIAQSECEKHKGLYYVNFPDIASLDADTGDSGERELAYKKLIEIKELITKGEFAEHSIDAAAILEEVKQTIKTESLPSLTTKEVAALEAILKKRGISSWVCTGQDGKKVRLTFEPEKSNADIDLTFRELYALKACTEALQTKEFGIAYKPTATSSKDDSK